MAERCVEGDGSERGPFVGDRDDRVAGDVGVR